MLQSSSSIQYSFSVLFIYSKSVCLHLIIKGFKYFLNQNDRNTYYFLIARKYFLPKEKPQSPVVRASTANMRVCFEILRDTKMHRTICNSVWFFVNPQSQLVVDVSTGNLWRFEKKSCKTRKWFLILDGRTLSISTHSGCWIYTKIITVFMRDLKTLAFHPKNPWDKRTIWHARMQRATSFISCVTLTASCLF